MADVDWDNEDFEVPVLMSVKVKANNFEEEEEEEELQHDITPKPAAKAAFSNKVTKSEAELKKEREADKALLEKVKMAKLENETPDQRKLRERQIVEAADAVVANELFNGSTSDNGEYDGEFRGIGSIPIRTKQDHIDFAFVCNEKMEESTPLCLAAFYTNMTNHLKEKFTVETCDEVIKMLTLVRDDKKKTQAKAPTAPKLSKKQVEAQKKKHVDKYGGADEDERYADYSNIEDDYMF